MNGAWDRPVQRTIRLLAGLVLFGLALAVLVQAELDRVNANYARVEQIKRFFILDHDLSQETGELTPTLKVKRNVINDKYAEDFEALYAS